ENAHLGPAAADLDGGAHALVGVGGRHPDVGDHHVRWSRRHLAQQRLGRAHGGEDLVALFGEEAHQALSQQGGVLGEDDAHGSSAVIVVGPPGGLWTVSLPSRAATRPRSPVSPPPAGSAPPRPSSRTVTSTWPPARATRTRT